MNQEESTGESKEKITTRTLRAWIGKNDELEQRLETYYKYETGNNTYLVSLCKRVQKSWLSTNSKHLVLLYLAARDGNIELGTINVEKNYVNWSIDPSQAKQCFNKFLSNMHTQQRENFGGSKFPNTIFTFKDKKITFFKLAQQITIWLDIAQNKQNSCQQYSFWKCIIARYFPYIYLPQYLNKNKGVVSDFLKTYKELVTDEEVLNANQFNYRWLEVKIIDSLLKQFDKQSEQELSSQKQVQGKFKQLQLTLIKFEKQSKQTQTTIENLNQKLFQSTKSQETCQGQFEQLKKQQCIDHQLIKELKKQVESLQKTATENTLLQQENKNINKINSELTSKIQKLEEQIEEKEKTIKTSQAQLKKMQTANKELRHQLKKAEIELQDKKQHINGIKQQLYLHIFEGQVLKNCICQKQYLRSEIEKYTGKHILMTNLLYRCDPLNKTNYHAYIDGHPHLALILRLKNKRLIAGYSVGPIVENTSTTEGGLILSLTAQKSFELLPGKKSVSYDTFFLIFGNSELRLKHADTTFFTNFGIANSFYNHRGEKHTVLTGGEPNSREEDIDTYEVFEVIFR